MDKLSELIARTEIQDSLMRYARGVDRRDWDSVRACYHEDGTDAHGDFSGNADDFIEWVKDRHATIPFAMHFMGNCLIEFIDDVTAAVETYFVASQRREKQSDDGDIKGTDVEVFGRYCDRFEKRNGIWKVAVRKVVYDNSRIQPSTNHLRKPVGILGQRDFSDAVYSLKDPKPVPSI